MMYRPNTPIVRRATTLGLALTAPLLLVAVASAGPASVQFRFNNEQPIALDQTGLEVGGGVSQYQGSFVDPAGRWTVTWDYVLNPDPAGTASLLGHTSISNTSGGTATFDFSIASPLCPAIAWQALYGGQVSAHLLMNEGGGLMTHVPGSHVWSAIADGGYAAGIFAPPFALGGSGAGTAVLHSYFGAPYPSQLGPGITDEAGVRLRFNLTDGDTAKITTSLFIGSPPGNLVECNPSAPLGDLNGDGMVNLQDLLILLSSWGRCDSCPADLNQDARVDIFDLLILMSNWS